MYAQLKVTLRYSIHLGGLSVTKLNSANNLPTFWPNASVVIRVEVFSSSMLLNVRSKVLFHIRMFTYISYVVPGSRHMLGCSLTCLFRAHSKISTYCSEWQDVGCIPGMIRDVHLHVCSGDIPRFSLIVLCSGHQMYDVLLFRDQAHVQVFIYTYICSRYNYDVKCLFTCLFREYSKVFTCSSLFRTPDVWRITVGDQAHVQMRNVIYMFVPGIFTCSSLFRTSNMTYYC